MMDSLILRAAARFLVSLILVFSVYFLFRGHNAPGGGFAGALIAATGFALYAISEGPESVRRAIRIDPRRLIVSGIILALMSGLPAVFAGKPFLTGIWGTISAMGGTIALGTPLFFDIGVFAIVLGAILLLILALEEDF